MLWLSLRTGFGNTAFIAALALLPLLSLAHPGGPVGPVDGARIAKAAGALDQDRRAVPARLASAADAD